jgi:GNAT superfamily N-acetyltransferase
VDGDQGVALTSWQAARNPLSRGRDRPEAGRADSFYDVAMAEPGPYRIERLTPKHGKEYLRFFDHERGPAFADNPEWAKCYCHYYEVPVAISWPALGFLAYSGDAVVGWVNAQPYHKLRHACARLRIAAPELPVPPHEAAAIVCFVTAPDWRRRGVASALLGGALENLAARGIRVVDAFPWNVGPEDTAATDHYHGSPAMFAAAGFVEIARHDKVTVVRRSLR